MAPPSCPDAEAVTEDVERLVGMSVHGRPMHEVVTVTGKVTVVDGRFRLELDVSGPTGAAQRDLQADHCRTLARAAALHIALAVDAAAVSSAAEGSVSVVAERSHEGPTAVVWSDSLQGPPKVVFSAGETPRSFTRRKRPAFVVKLMSGANAAVLPGIGPGIGGGLGAAWLRARVELVGVYWFVRSARYLRHATTGADLRMGAASLRACWTPGVRAVEIPLCAGLELGAIAAAGVGVQEPKTRRTSWVAATAGLGASWRPGGRLAAFVAADLVVPLQRAVFGVTGLGVVFRSAPVGAQGFLGAELRFW